MAINGQLWLKPWSAGPPFDQNPWQTKDAERASEQVILITGRASISVASGEIRGDPLCCLKAKVVTREQIFQTCKKISHIFPTGNAIMIMISVMVFVRVGEVQELSSGLNWYLILKGLIFFATL